MDKNKILQTKNRDSIESRSHSDLAVNGFKATGVGLGWSTGITLMGISFAWDAQLQMYKLTNRSYSLKELKYISDKLFEYMHSINVKGYLTLDSLECKFIKQVELHVEQMGYEPRSLGNAEMPYTMWYNFLFVNLYYLVVAKMDVIRLTELDQLEIYGKILYKIMDPQDKLEPLSEEYKELLADIECVKASLLARLDQFLKAQTQKRGISIIQNTYTGFDSEYQLLNEKKCLNELVSVQTAVQCRTIIKIPLDTPFDLSYVHPVTSEVSDVFLSKVGLKQPFKDTFIPDIYTTLNPNPFLPKPKVDEKDKKPVFDEVDVLNNSLKHSIKLIRGCLFASYDALVTQIISELKTVKGITFYEDDKRAQVVFFLPLTPMVSNIVYPDRGKFSVNDLILMSQKPNLPLESVFLEPLCPQKSTIFSSLFQKLFLKVGTLFKKGYLHTNRGGGVCLSASAAPLGLCPSASAAPLGLSNEATSVVLPNLASNLREDFYYFVLILSKLGLNNFDILNWFENSKIKPRFRKLCCFDEGARLSISIIKNTYVIAHYNAADLSMLSDFDEFKHKLSIVNKSFLSLGKPLVFNNTQVHFRDTMLLAPAGNQSLAAIGKIYNIPKIELPQEVITNMKGLLKSDKDLYEKYAKQDAIIALKHALGMEEFNFSVKEHGIPSTLSSLGRKFVASEWKREFRRHLPYQISGEYLMGNADEIQTPKGLFATGDVGAHLSYYIANYKGGRNESFMYGTDETTTWIDYDLVSAYTTGMAELSLPDYKRAGTIPNAQEVLHWEDDQLLKGYLIINATFVFPESVKYPSIPCYLDKTTTVYPMEGEGFLTGPELLLARKQGCQFYVKNAFHIPAKSKFDKAKAMDVITKPFYGIIKNIQAMRREFPKGHIKNMLYKEMGNGMYGNIVRGMSNKKSFDASTGKSTRVSATELSNPILAS